MYTIVSDLMRIRHSSILPESASLREAAERLIVSDCDVLAITDAAGKLTGMLSESCVVKALLAGAHESVEIRSIVSHHTPSVRPDSGVNSVLPLFRSAAVTAVPVVRESGEICGLLLRRDVIAALVRSRAEAGSPAVTADCRKANLSAETVSPITAASESADFEMPVDPVPETNVPRWKPGSLAGPHFLRGTAAKRVLWPAEDRL
jgi:CBS domain-containing protein